MILKLAIAASNRGWRRLSAFLLELDLALSGLAGVSRRIRREQAKRRKRPHARIAMVGPY